MVSRLIVALATLCIACPDNNGPIKVHGDGVRGDPFTGDAASGDAATGDPASGDPGNGDPKPGDPGAGDPKGDPSGPGDPGPAPIRVVTFNTGTSKGMAFGIGADYGSDEADISDEWYGNGLAWRAAIDGATAWFAAVQPELVVFQEIFHPEECTNIPSQHHTGFICETWQAGDPTVAQMVLGNDYQVACHLGKPDKCAAVKKSFGSIAGCDQDLCIEGLDGFRINNCGGGSRNGRGVIELVDGGELTLVNHHGSSGVSSDDQDCRVKQIDQIFVDFGDGQPAANGERNIVLGDLNTDPARWRLWDSSSDHWGDFVGHNRAFDWITDATDDATPTYGDIVNLDHVISDVFTGSCLHSGIDGLPPVLDFIYFDHMPAICTLSEP